VKYGHRAGLEDVTPHVLRHTYARALIASGASLSDVADLLGHTCLDTTRIYTKASETDLATAVARLEERKFVMQCVSSWYRSMMYGANLSVGNPQ
jgi:site-specific recombinase XerD